MSAITISHLDVIFGKHTQQSLALLDKGYDRQKIIDETGDVVGVQDATISVERGEICVLMGLSGSGKSSLLRAVNGLNTVSRGQLLVEDKDKTIDVANCNAKTLRHLRSHVVSMVFQKFALMPWLSVLDNVAFGLTMRGMDKTTRQQQALKQLEMVGLEQWQHSLPHELSGGMQQRVGLARAFAMDSDILLMDEPFSALDPLIRSQLQDELISLQKKLNKTIIFVSHDLDEALKIGTNIAIMEDGKIVQQGQPEQIILNPSTDYVKDFVSHTNPLNVLKGKSLMTPMSELTRQGNRLLLNDQQNTQIELDSESQTIIQAQQADQTLPIVHWNIGDTTDHLSLNQLVCVPTDITMRDAMAIRYQTRSPIILCNDQGGVEGSLSNQQFYHALLGKHF